MIDPIGMVARARRPVSGWEGGGKEGSEVAPSLNCGDELSGVGEGVFSDLLLCFSNLRADLSQEWFECEEVGDVECTGGAPD